MIIEASLSKPHIDCDNVPRRRECWYLSMYLAVCSVCRINVPENTPIQSITHSAHVRRQRTRHWTMDMLDSKLQESTPETWVTLGTRMFLL